jgi:RNA polymerase sigma factor (sigma-70 family)
MVSPSLTVLRTQSDERLLALARAGHERAFEAIVERYRRPLLRHGRRLLPEARAEEAVQQTFVAVWAALQRGDDVRHLSGWLHRIVHNAALNALRGERDDYAELREWLDAGSAPDEQLERRELLRETLANLAALPERQREALLRVAIDGVPAEEVGGSLGLTEGAVRQLLYRARTALRAAATAVTPMPVASWLARAEPLTASMAEAATGAGSAGLASLLAKAGVVAVVAGAAATGPAVLDGSSQAEPHRPPAPRAAARAATLAPIAEYRAPAATTPAPVTRDDHSGPGRGDDSDDSSGHGSSGSGSSDSSGPGSGSSGSSDSLDSSGSGSSGSSGSSDSSGSGSSGSSDSSDSSGSGSSGSSDSSDSSGSGSSGSSGSGSSGSDEPDAD